MLVVPSLRGGGAERVMSTLARCLSRETFRITLVVVSMRGAVFHKELPNDIDLVDCSSTGVLRAMPRIVALVWSKRPDVILSTLGHLNLAIAALRFVLPRSMCTIARETNIIGSSLAGNRWRAVWSVLYRLLYPIHDVVICQSWEMREDLKRNFSIPVEKMRVLYNPLDTEVIRQLARTENVYTSRPKGLISIVAVGRLSFEKGFDLLLKAIQLLPHINLELCILGAGPLENALRQQSIEYGVVDRVRFLGFKSNPYPWIAGADAVIFSSRYDSFPNVVLEALACGTPVIATPARGGVGEILAGVEGCVVAQAISARSLASAIQGWIAGPRARVSLQSVERFGRDRIVAEYESLLIEVQARCQATRGAEWPT